MHRPGGDRQRRTAGPEVDGWKVVPHLTGLVADVVFIGHAVDHLGAPALDRAIVEERARLHASSRNRQSRSSDAEVDLRESIAHLRGTDAAGLGVAEAQLPIAIFTPALDGSIVEERARMIGPRRHGQSRAALTEVYWRQTRAHLARPRASRVRRTEAEHAASPASQRVIVEDGAGAEGA